MVALGIAISEPVRRALTESVHCEGSRVTITERLSDELWLAVKKVLTALDAVYILRASAYEFQPWVVAKDVIAHVLQAGRVMTEANARGFVATPAELAEELIAQHVHLDECADRPRVLEPSAGTGRLVQAFIDEVTTSAFELTAVEPIANRAWQIPTDDRVTVLVEPFEEFAARVGPAGERFDLVIMNPPFAVPGQATLWVDHLFLAWELLAPGGRLVAIVPNTVFDTSRGGRIGEARRLVELHGDGERLDRSAFAESGITYGTAVVSLDRPPIVGLPATSATLDPDPRFRSYRGDETPVVVRRPVLTRGAALTMPVQQWRDPWRTTPRVLRFRAGCLLCDEPTWGFDDGEDDPRGRLGHRSACYSLVPEWIDEAGRARVALCATCGNDGEQRDKALARARALWAQEGTPSPAAAIAAGEDQLQLDLSMTPTS